MATVIDMPESLVDDDVLFDSDEIEAGDEAAAAEIESAPVEPGEPDEEEEEEEPEQPTEGQPEPESSDGGGFELQCLVDIYEAELECRRCEAEIAELKQSLKDSKDTYNAAVITLRRLCYDAKPERKSVTPAPVTIQYDSTQPVFGGLVDQPEETEPESLDWRNVLLANIGINGIKGLGKKKREALTELCPTLGAFEDLRAKVGKDAATLQELLPKGIGQAMADELEELVLNWLTKNRDQVESSDGESTSATVQQPVEELSHEDQVSLRAKEIDTGEDGCLDGQLDDDGIWESGKRAYEKDASIWECPWTPGPNQDEWIRGWMAGKCLQNYEEATVDADDL